MSESAGRSDWRTLYVWTITVAGAAAIVDASQQLAASGIGYRWLILVFLTILASSASVRIGSVNATISIAETFVFAAVLLFGQAAGTLTVALDGLVLTALVYRRHISLERLLFNAAQPALSLWLSAALFFRLAGITPLAVQANGRAASVFWAVLVLTLVYYLLNTGVVSVAVGLEKHTSPYRIWRDNFTWIAVNYVAGAALAVLFVDSAPGLDFRYLAIVALLLGVFYLTFRGAIGRVEDAIRHLQELNRLHLATIETLAAAVDAKDHTTHGHLRRVQDLALDLARTLNVSDSAQVRAIEAAALLHDLGKLAVPDYILNKPGKLSAAEFERIKQHSGAGADLLSTIDFPYPVVPIVRHHHEGWDGSGYPDGLKGEDIPIGARILSVVDCYDALTTDRPYRRRLSVGEALQIIVRRRGTMYDPMVVDAFLRLHPESAAEGEEARADTTPRARREAVRVTPHAGSVQAPSALSPETVGAILSLGQRLATAPHLTDAAYALTTTVGTLIPASLTVFFGRDASRDELLALAASGAGAEQTTDLRITLGHRLSGWVGANQQSLLNGDPRLDFEAGESVSDLRSCLSCAIVHRDQLVGVLSLYSTSPQAFDLQQLMLLQLVAGVVAAPLDAHR